ncbi:MAG: NAD(+) synthase [Bacteroidetes bacterium]|nr:NAD(+) synthase [Bacteroidota bacterium]
MVKMKNEVVKWINDRVKTAGAEGLVLGLSGGIDSAVVAALCNLAYPGKTLGLIMPCGSQPEDENYAGMAAATLKIETVKVVLDEVFTVFKKLLPDSSDIRHYGNIKSRLRMISLYYYAGINNYLVAGTGNKTEISLGYFTKYGDGGCDILPLGDLYKYEVKLLAEELGIPREIIERKPTAGLWKDQTDEDEIGIPYDEIDSILGSLQGNNKLKETDAARTDRIKQMMRVTEHKRIPIPIFKKTEDL